LNAGSSAWTLQHVDVVPKKRKNRTRIFVLSTRNFVFVTKRHDKSAMPEDIFINGEEKNVSDSNQIVVRKQKIISREEKIMSRNKKIISRNDKSSRFS